MFYNDNMIPSVIINNAALEFSVIRFVILPLYHFHLNANYALKATLLNGFKAIKKINIPWSKFIKTIFLLLEKDYYTG